VVHVSRVLHRRQKQLAPDDPARAAGDKLPLCRGTRFLRLTRTRNGDQTKVFFPKAQLAEASDTLTLIA
jgi:hypothetical protein